MILPLTTLDKNSDRKDIEPLALLVHPQQPLSYLERLIQSELPTIEGKNGKEKVPDVFFRAEDSATDEIGAEGKENEEDIEPGEEGSDAQMIDGKMVKLGKIEKDKKPESSKEVDKLEELETGLRGGPGEGGRRDILRSRTRRRNKQRCEIRTLVIKYGDWRFHTRCS